MRSASALRTCSIVRSGSAPSSGSSPGEACRQILAATSQKGQTCVCTKLYWKGHLVKARIALAEGKKTHDKRDSQKEREWNLQKQRVIRQAVKQ